MKNIITCVFGRKGSGKTTFVQKRLIPKFSRVLILDTLSEYPFFYFYDLAMFIQSVKQNYNKSFFRITYRPADELDDYFFKFCYSLSNITVIVEEADLYSNAFSANEYFEKIIKYGRHKNINLIAVSRRPAEISKTLISQSDYVITFQQILKRDIDFFRLYINNPERLKELKVGQYRIVQGKSLPKKFA